MSVPVSMCLLAKAAASETAYQRVLERMRYNLECKSFAFWPCTHTPPCAMPPAAEIEKLTTRLAADLRRATAAPPLAAPGTGN